MSADFDSLVSGQTRGETRGEIRGETRVDSALPAPPASEELTIIDRWWSRMLRTPRRQLAWRIGGPLGVTLLAAVLRLWNISSPASLVFDETYYVKDAWSMTSLGYEGQWPDGADARFNAGDVNIFTSAGEYIAHPPLGKWLISLGMQAFGGDNPLGWRISTAIVGVLAVALLCLIALALFRSTLLATIAGGLFAIDGLAISMSRTALLDNFLMFFTLLGFGAILLDRRQAEARLAAWLARRRSAGLPTDWAPAIWWRPWLVSAGLAFGLATAVKWSGLYFLAAFAVYSLLVDAVARRRAGVTFWASSTALLQSGATFLLTVPVAVVAYVASWTGWFVTSGGYGRDWAATAAASGTGQVFSWLPLSLQSFWHYQVSIYNTNIALSTPHAYQANPLTWLLLVRPTAFYYEGSAAGENGCPFDGCSEYVTSIANPILWWLSVAAAVYLLVRFVRLREWRASLILAGVAAGYLPWLLYLDRTVFQFYTIVFLPYLILALVFVIGLVLGHRTDPPGRRSRGIAIVASALLLIVLVSAFFYSAWTGLTVPSWFQSMHYVLPSWR